MRNEKISVCMATYNGSKYLDEQIKSILNQLVDDDELIIVDDCSTDSTLDILNNFKDQRIIIIVNEVNIGHIKSFEKAISLSRNEIIFMADQDDIWVDHRVDKMVNILKNHDVNLVSGNSIFIDGYGNESSYAFRELKENESKKMLKNILNIFIGKGAYFGCAMAFKRELVSTILPFPNYIESHDLWIAQVSILQGKSWHLEDAVLYRRIHTNNVSVIRRPCLKKIRTRFIYVAAIINILFRNVHNK